MVAVPERFRGLVVTQVTRVRIPSVTLETTNDGGHVLYKIELGDWSGDGHSITRTFRVEANYDFEDLQANYLKNTEKYGFGIDDLAPDYDDNSFPTEWYEAIVADGFAHTGELEEYNGRYYLFDESLIEVAMFLIGNGLSGFNWSFAHDDATLLFGGGKLKGRKGYPVSAGYGLYTP